MWGDFPGSVDDSTRGHPVAVAGFGSVPLCSLKVKSESDASGLGFVKLTEGEYHRRVIKELNGQPLNH